MDDERNPYALNVCVIAIKDLHMTLLAYLLTNGMGNPIRRDDILKYVWDDRNLKSSSQTLWATLKELKYNLSLVGLTDDFIISNRGAYYRINARKIEALYVGRSDNFH
jgi:two-component SAPR family response regulator